MKKFMTIVAALVFVGAFAAIGGDRYTGTLTVPAGGTTASVTQELFRADGPPCTELDTVFVTVESGTGTGVVVFAVSEFGETDTVSTSGSLVLGDAFYDRPVVSESVLYTYPVVQNVVTGDVIVARSNLQSNYVVSVKSPLARQLKITATQLAVAEATVYRWVLMTRTDPPPTKK